MNKLRSLAADAIAADTEIALMISSGQPATPDPPHRVGALTTSELSAYRKQLERAIQDLTVGSATIASDLRAKLSEVAEEEAERERHRSSRQRWPINN